MTHTKDEAMKLALEVLQWSKPHKDAVITHGEAIAAIVAALAQQAPVQEPVTDEENEIFSRDVSNFKGADPEATKYALEQFLKNRKTAAQPAQEPVAIKRMKEWIEYLKRKSDFGQHMKIPCEISAGTCWELAIELEQFINTTPPQRTWAGLTDREKSNLWLESRAALPRFYTYASLVETKLKAKNGFPQEEKNT